MRSLQVKFIWIFAIALSLFLAACTFPGGKAAQNNSGPTPSPTAALWPANPYSKSGLAGFNVVSVPICRLAEFRLINIFANQGNLVAWSPDGTRIAFIRPTTALTWFVGDLVIASGKNYSTLKVVAPYANGSVTWSPDGKSLAFVALRPDDKVYTVQTVNDNGTGLTDLFPERAAHTDTFSSPKTILGWPSVDHLHVQASCGSSCIKSLDIILPGNSSSEYNPTDSELKYAWRYPVIAVKNDPALYPVMNEPNQSPDGRFIVYLDEKYYLWLLDATKKTIHPVYMPDMFPVYASQPWARETHYSPKNELAVRIDNLLDIFNPSCSRDMSVTER